MQNARVSLPHPNNNGPRSNPWALVREAHVLRATACKAPALIMHLGVWPLRTDDPQNAPNAEVFNQRLERIFDSLNRFIDLFQQDGLVSPDYVKQHFEADKRQNSKEKVWRAKRADIEFHISWQGLRIQIRADAHTEYATVAFWCNLEDGARSDYKTEIEAQLKNAGRPDKAAEAAEFLYVQFWDRFLSDIYRRSGRGQEAGAVGDEALDASEALGASEVLAKCVRGEIFANLRGVAAPVGMEAGEAAGEPVANDKGAGDGADTHNPLKKAWHTLTNFRTAEADAAAPFAKRSLERKFAADEPHAIIKAYQGFVSPKGFNDDPREFVACLMMNQQALFISPFAAEAASEAAPTGEEHFVRYLVFAKNEPNSRQLGRLIELINALGTLQVIALKDLSQIREIGTAIRFAGDDLDIYSEQLCNDLKDNRWLSKEIQINLGALETKLDEISFDDASQAPVGGLPYRVARARYYANQFKTRIDDLNIEPIEYWQPYDVFVRRRLYATFQYIGSVGDRMINLRNRLHAIMEGAQTKTLVGLTEGVHRIHTSEQWQTAILFTIALSVFSGEVLEATAKWPTGNEKVYFYVEWAAEKLAAGRGVGFFAEVKAEAEKACRAPKIAPAIAGRNPETTGSIRGVEDKEACAAYYRVAGYVSGALLGVGVTLASYAFGFAWGGLRSARRTFARRKH